jgi:nucleoside-diphosphate-sugar epimerase
MIENQELFVKEKDTIKEVMQILDRNNSSVVSIVSEEAIVKGAVTSEEIRNALMNGSSVNSQIMELIDKGEQNQGEKVLIVGGAGYLGIQISEKLLEKGHKVRILDSMIFGEKPISKLKENPNFEIMRGDMRNITQVTSSLKGIHTVILLAGIVGDPATSEIPKETIEANYLATLTFARACKYYQINRFIFASTCSVYGANSKIVTEEDSLNPLSLYARLKIDSEKNILSLKDENFSPTILRMATLYGLSPRMRFDLVVNVFTMKATNGEKISIFGGNQWRPFISVQDAAEAYVKCLEAPIDKVAGEIFNVGAQNLTINEVKDFVKEVFPALEVELAEREVVEGAIDSRNYKVSFDKIKNTIGFEGVKTVKDAIMEIRDYIQEGNISEVNDAIYYNVKMVNKE